MQKRRRPDGSLPPAAITSKTINEISPLIATARSVKITMKHFAFQGPSFYTVVKSPLKSFCSSAFTLP